jgi:hypothetical protein
MAGTLFYALSKSHRLLDPHRPSGVVAVLFEIEHEQDLFGPTRRIGRAPGGRNRAQEEIRLVNRIARVRKVVRAPKKTGARRLSLASGIFIVAHVSRIGGFMYHTNNALVLHLLEIDPHQVVMRKVDHAVARARANQQRLQDKQNEKKGRSHWTYDSRDESALNKMKSARLPLSLPLCEFVQGAA